LSDGLLLGLRTEVGSPPGGSTRRSDPARRVLTARNGRNFSGLFGVATPSW